MKETVGCSKTGIQRETHGYLHEKIFIETRRHRKLMLGNTRAWLSYSTQHLSRLAPVLRRNSYPTNTMTTGCHVTICRKRRWAFCPLFTAILTFWRWMIFCDFFLSIKINIRMKTGRVNSVPYNARIGWIVYWFGISMTMKTKRKSSYQNEQWNWYRVRNCQIMFLYIRQRMCIFTEPYSINHK
jgi:hypothetical protein